MDEFSQKNASQPKIGETHLILLQFNEIPFNKNAVPLAVYRGLITPSTGEDSPSAALVFHSTGDQDSAKPDGTAKIKAVFKHSLCQTLASLVGPYGVTDVSAVFTEEIIKRMSDLQSTDQLFIAFPYIQQLS